MTDKFELANDSDGGYEDEGFEKGSPKPTDKKEPPVAEPEPAVETASQKERREEEEGEELLEIERKR